jgi:hypothetical protein
MSPHARFPGHAAPGRPLAPGRLAWRAGPAPDFNPLLQMSSGIRVFNFEQIHETHRVMEANEANGKTVVVHD